MCCMWTLRLLVKIGLVCCILALSVRFYSIQNKRCTMYTTWDESLFIRPKQVQNSVQCDRKSKTVQPIEGKQMAETSVDRNITWCYLICKTWKQWTNGDKGGNQGSPIDAILYMLLVFCSHLGTFLAWHASDIPYRSRYHEGCKVQAHHTFSSSRASSRRSASRRWEP